MRRILLLVTATALYAVSLPASQGQTLPQPASFFAQSSAKQAGCDAYYRLQQLDPSVLSLLGTPVFPANSGVFANPAYVQLRDWDFPPKVASWQERPKPEEIAEKRQELLGGSSSGSQDKSKSASSPASAWISGPYGLEPFSAHDWNELQKWFAKEGPKKLAGLCVDANKTGYILAVGVVTQGASGTSASTASARIQYDQSVISQNASTGPNAATQTPGGGNRPAQELSGMNDSSRTGVHTCAYLFRTNGEGGARLETPDYYYCRSSDEEPRAAITTMLKYLAKNTK